MLAANAENSKSRVVREMAILLEDLEEDGSSALPSDEEIKQWENVDCDDDDSWLDINYEDFERELEGKQAASSSKAKSGFGEAQTQENLRKIVSRFEAFLNDESAGLEGAELDRMDVDDDDEGDDDDEDMDDEVSFDEGVFSEMMKQMMGIAATGTAEEGKNRTVDAAEDAMDSDAEEDRDIQELASRMEAELKEYGSLQLDPPTTNRAIKSKENLDKGKQPMQKESNQQASAADDEDEEIDIDFNLAKNLLESFKSQGGMAGPAGNLMGLMGFQLPRDEDDEEQTSHD